MKLKLKENLFAKYLSFNKKLNSKIIFLNLVVKHNYL